MNYKIYADGWYSTLEATEESDDNPNVYASFEEARRALQDHIKRTILDDDDWKQMNDYLSNLIKEEIDDGR